VVDIDKRANNSDADLPAGFKMTELGPLPEEWKVVHLSEVFVPVDKKERLVRIQAGKVYKTLTVKLYAKGITLREEIDGAKIGTAVLYRTEPNDFVFSKIDARNGAWGFVPDELGGSLVSGDFPILQLIDTLADRDFIALCLSRPNTWEPLRDIAVGTTNRRRVQVQELLRISIPLPPLPEQRAIAHVLRTVQRAKEATERVIQATRELKKSLMRYLFTYGPVPMEEAERVPLKETEIGLVPEHWEVVRLGEVVQLRTEVVKPSEVSDDVRYIGLEHIDSGESQVKRWGCARDVQSTKNKFYPGDVLYGKLRPYLDKAVLAEFEGICSTDILVFKPLGQLEPLYLVNLLHTPRFIEYASATTTGVNRPRTSWKAIENFAIPFPPSGEKDDIARILQAVNKKLQAEEARKQALEELFKTLLHNLMTGEIRVKDVVLPNVGEGKGDITN
jgi:type I restriction enzyme S subunit